MSIKLPKTDFSINSLIGETSSCSGDFVSHGPLRIDGKFSGTIKSRSKVFIGKKGYADCTIIAKNLVIGGTVKGDMYIEGNLVALKTAEIIGNIYAVSVRMDDGVIFDGECRVVSKESIQKLINNLENEKAQTAEKQESSDELSQVAAAIDKKLPSRSVSEEGLSL